MSDAVLQELTIRMATDPGFASQVGADPATLDGFDLTPAERTQLVSLDADQGAGAAGLGSRESKSGIMGMLGGLGGHDHSHPGMSVGEEDPELPAAGELTHRFAVLGHGDAEPFE